MFTETREITEKEGARHTVDKNRWPAAGNGSQRFAEPAPTPDVINWDLRPRGEVGNLAGAEGREEARMKRMIEIGALADGEVSGKITRTVHDPHRRTTVVETVVACQPIPIMEMVPHSATLREGVVTPLWPEGQALFLLGDNQPTEVQE